MYNIHFYYPDSRNTCNDF